MNGIIKIPSLSMRNLPSSAPVRGACFRNPLLVVVVGVLSFLVACQALSVMPRLVGAINLHLFGIQDQLFLPAWLSYLFGLGLSVYFIGSFFPFLLFSCFSLLPNRRKAAEGSLPFVSVIIPSFNEASNIALCLESAMRIDYPSYEVIVVDDGSKDLTFPVIEQFGVSVISLRSNRGKAEALNMGIERAKGEIVFMTDSDSYLDSMVLRRLVSGFGDLTVGAVAGKVVLKGNKTYLQRMQQIEYLYGQSVIKEAQIRSGYSVSICPGPVTAFRRSVLLQCGGFRKSTLAEDFDITLELLRLGYKALYEPRAIAYTTGISNWSRLKQQRIRWSRGHLQVFCRYHAAMFTRSMGTVSLFWLPWSLYIGYGFLLIELFFFALVPLALLLSVMPLVFLKTGIVYMVLLEGVTALEGIMALIRSRQVTPALLASTFLTQPYRIFLCYTRVIAFCHEVQRRKNIW